MTVSELADWLVNHEPIACYRKTTTQIVQLLASEGIDVGYHVVSKAVKEAKKDQYMDDYIKLIAMGF